MNFIKHQPDSLITVPNGNLTILPPDIDSLKKLLDEMNKKLADYESRFKSLSDEIANKKFTPNRSAGEVFKLNDIVHNQNKNGYYEIPYNCFIEVKCSGDTFTLWLNVPDNNPYKTLMSWQSQYGWSDAYNKLMRYQIYDATGYTNTTTIIANKGDKLVLSFTHNSHYNLRTQDFGEYNNSRSYIKIIPFS